MVFERKKIKSTSRSTAEVEPIVLRETSTTRLVFKPLMVKNQKNPEASLKGSFLYQKKGRNDEWEDIKNINFNSLKSGEGVSINLKSAELLHLVKNLIPLYKLFDEKGITFGETEYVKLESEFSNLSQASEEDFKKFLELNSKAGVNIINQFFNWLTGSGDEKLIINKLTKLKPSNLNKIDSLLNLGKLKKALTTWENNQNNPDEEFWQNHFLLNSFLLSSLFSFPILIVKDKAYVGGKSFQNTGGSLIDFLCRNELTDNAVLIEIKTPVTPLLSQAYRTGIYNIHKEISGAVMQVLNYKQSLIENSYQLNHNSETSLHSFYPKCLVIAGNTSKLNSRDEKKSFEIYRNNVSGVEIITYDELFARIKKTLDLLEN